MKLKLIKDSEVVISRERYEELINKPSRTCEVDCRYFSNAITHCTAKYECSSFAGSYIVYISGENCIYPIKNFCSDDLEYNRVCAEELVELLNQEQ